MNACSNAQASASAEHATPRLSVAANMTSYNGKVSLNVLDRLPLPDVVSVDGCDFYMQRVTFDDGGSCGCCGETVNDFMDFCPGCGARIGRKL